VNKTTLLLGAEPGEMETVILRDGTEVAKPLVSVVMLVLRGLATPNEEDPLAGMQNVLVLYELVMKARDPNHEFFSPQLRDQLRALKLLEHDDTVHDAIRPIIQNAVTGDLMEMALRNPVRP